MQLTTAQLKSGDQVSLVDFGHTQVSIQRRMSALGLTRGVPVYVVRRAPLGCPLQLQVRGTQLIIRESEAAEIRWESF